MIGFIVGESSERRWRGGDTGGAGGSRDGAVATSQVSIANHQPIVTVSWAWTAPRCGGAGSRAVATAGVC
jgi:hypothetical protein